MRKVAADALCGSGYYCLGTRPMDDCYGCNIWCERRCTRRIISCDGNCDYWINHITSCCPIDSSYQNFRCCVSSGGGGGGGGGGCTCTSAAAAPDLETPADGATVNNPITFEWDRGSWGESCCGGRGTRIDIDFDPSFSHIGVSNRYDSGDRDDFTDDNVELTLDFDPGVYYWRVRQYNEEGGHWSNTFSFTLGNQAPECQSITGPTWQRWPGASTFQTSDVARVFNVEARDLDMNSMTYVWDSPDCGGSVQQVPIDYFNIRVRGQNNNGFPVMDVYVIDTAGNRNLVNNCSGYTATSSWETVTCDLSNQPASLIEILYSEDDGSRMLEIDNIDIYYVDGSSKLVQAESANDTGDHVFYDRARTNIPFMELMTDAFDGMDVLDGQQNMGVPGSLRFPVPIIFNTPATDTTCTLRVRATDRFGLTDDGSVCTYPVDICGDAPDEVVNGQPNGVTDWPLNDPITWDQPSSFGDICVGSLTPTFTVHGRAQPVGEGACPAPDPEPFSDGANYSVVPTCSNMNANFPGDPPDCLDPFFGTEDTDYCWYVVASNGEYYSISDVWSFETEHTLIGKEWMTTVGGPLYVGSLTGSGGVGPMSLPDPSDYADQYLTPPPPVPWSPPYIAYVGSDGVDVFSLSQDIMDIEETDPTDPYFPESQSHLFAENTSLTYTWPRNFDGNAPSDATEIASGFWCTNVFRGGFLDPDNTYYIEPGCAEVAIQGVVITGGQYSLAQDGTVVVYIENSGGGAQTVPISNEFRAPNDNQRIVFVTGEGVNIEIDRTLASPDPVDFDNLPPALIEAAFVIAGESNYLEFEGTSDPDGPEGSDSSIVVEGPIIGKQLLLGRNRDTQNYFPGEIVKFNNSYMYELTQKEREGGFDNNFTGLFTTDVDWVSEE